MWYFVYIIDSIYTTTIFEVEAWVASKLTQASYAFPKWQQIECVWSCGKVQDSGELDIEFEPC